MASLGTAPVPAWFPLNDNSGMTPVPGTGPYKVAFENQHEIRYIRNPHFHEWSHTAQPDGNPDVIVMRFGLSPAQEVRTVERGKADWTADGVSATLLPGVLHRFPAQWHPLLTSETDYFQLNPSVPPFNDIRVRQALNLAIDRTAIAHIYGGSQSATPTCQILPPSLPGYRPYCPYTRPPIDDGHWHAPDIARARHLVTASGTRGDQVTVFGPSDHGTTPKALVLYIVHLLNRLGYHAQANLEPTVYFAGLTPIVWSTIQITENSNFGTTPYQFLGSFRCSAATIHHWFCNHHLDNQIRSAQTLEATNTQAANTRWTEIDREIVNQALWVPLVNPASGDLVSKRLHGYQADPRLGLIADQPWLH
jgi:peptide/nickel transport system substrate-binding protein